MKTVANLFAVAGLFAGLASFLFSSSTATHIALVGIVFIAFGIVIHLDQK